MSLKDRIKEANSVEELEELIKEGVRYQFASPGIRRKWAREAQKRAQQIGK
jgi:hypothetical protein